MNVQAHLSGQISGQVQNQLQPQQNGNQQMQTLSAPNAPTTGGVAVSGAHPVNLYNVEPDFVRYRMLMQQKIFTIISQRQSQPIGDLQKQKFKEFARRLEEGLFKAAQTKDDYVDMSTLEIRLSSLLKRPLQIAKTNGINSLLILPHPLVL
ncbi:histone acetyltransferase HAC [Salix suchowensis]|nr:histone acetyltransferase HAC [Salix suchowensis]